MFDGTTGADHERPATQYPAQGRSDRLRRLGDRLFRDSDARARAHGWEVTSRHRGLARSYRDPRLDALGAGAARRLVDDWPGRPPPDPGPPAPVSTSDTPGYGRLPGHTVSPMERAAVPLARPNPAVVVWRWRWELGAAVAAVAAALFGGARIGPLWTVLAGVGAGAVVAAVPGLRRAAVRRAWCVLTPHRVRTGCAHAWIQSRTGKIPAVLWTSAVPVGERVTLWCRPGTTAEDLEAARELLATACWARDVEVQRHPRRSQLAALVVVRHPARRPRRRRV